MTTPTTLARGEADVFERALFRSQVLTTVRYADPAAWVVATAAARAFAAVPETVAAAGDRVSVVVTSPRGPVETMAWMASATREGSSSPLRFPASNPGSLAGVTCIVLGLRGPTLMLTMAPGQGVPLALRLSEQWMARGDVTLALVAACWEQAPGKHVARCLLVGGPSSPTPDHPAEDGAWLAGLEAQGGAV